MKSKPITVINQRSSTVPLIVNNQCQDTIYPGLLSQAGTPPNTNGFELSAGDSRSLTVGTDWQGRVWGRTNCSFNAAGTGASNNGGINGGGKACVTGDCGGIVECQDAGAPPASLAEFTLIGGSSQTFYDISLVDGYNLPIAIVFIPGTNQQLKEIPPNLTNPVCIGTASLLAAQGSTLDEFLGSTSQYPLPLDQSVSNEYAQNWCPIDLEVLAITGPSNGVYQYPDSDLQVPDFNPCLSACAKNGRPQDCCTGSYDSPTACKASTYSEGAKTVCPDAYSYAFDDQDSTFIIPSGGGFEVIFCPPGRSTTILKTKARELAQLAETGHVTENTNSEGAEAISAQNEGVEALQVVRAHLLALAVTTMIILWHQGLKG